MPTSYDLLLGQLQTKLSWYADGQITVIANIIANLAFKRSIAVESQASAALFIQEVEQSLTLDSEKARQHWGTFLMSNWPHLEEPTLPAVLEALPVGLQTTQYVRRAL